MGSKNHAWRFNYLIHGGIAVAKTFNRLSQYNGLETSDRLTSLSIPLTSNAYSVVQWSIDEDVSYAKNHLVLKVLKTYLPTIGDPISVSGIAFEDVAGYAPIGTDPNPVALNQSYSIVNIVSDATYYYLHCETALDWSMGEIFSTAHGAYSVSVYFLYPQRWACVGGTISVVGDIFDVKSRYAIKINPGTSGPVTIHLTDKTRMLLEDNGKDFSFNGKIYCTEQTDVMCRLVYSEWLGIDGDEPGFATIYPGRFAAFRSNVEMLPLSEEDTYGFDVSITLTNHGGQVMYLTSPHLIEDFLYYSNPYVYSALSSMPDFYWEMDSNQTNPSAPLHRLIDCLMTGASDVYDEYLRIYHYEPRQLGVLAEQHESNDTHSTLVNPQYVDSRYAPWLSQFNGHRLKKNIKYLYNGLTDTTYAAPQDMYTSTGAVESYIRWQLSKGYYGRAAGTTEAIREAAKQVLHYTKDGEDSTYFVSITAHYGSDPFKILIRTLLNETFDCELNGDESYSLLDAVEMAKPMGYKIYHEAVDVVEFRIGDIIPGTKADGTVVPGNPIGGTADGMYPLGNVVPNDATGTPESGILI